MTPGQSETKSVHVAQVTASDSERTGWQRAGWSSHSDGLWMDQDGCLVGPLSLCQVTVCSLYNTWKGQNVRYFRQTVVWGPLAFFGTKQLWLHCQKPTPGKTIKVGKEGKWLPLIPSLHWQIDFIQKDKAANMYSLSSACFLEAFPPSNASATSVAPVFLEQIFPTWDSPSTVSSDRGFCFFGKIT